MNLKVYEVFSKLDVHFRVSKLEEAVMPRECANIKELNTGACSRRAFIITIPKTASKVAYGQAKSKI